MPRTPTWVQTSRAGSGARRETGLRGEPSTEPPMIDDSTLVRWWSCPGNPVRSHSRRPGTGPESSFGALSKFTCAKPAQDLGAQRRRRNLRTLVGQGSRDAIKCARREIVSPGQRQISGRSKCDEVGSRRCERRVIGVDCNHVTKRLHRFSSYARVRHNSFCRRIVTRASSETM